MNWSAADTIGMHILIRIESVCDRPYIKILAMKTKNQSIITLKNMKGAIRKELIKLTESN